MGCSIYDHKNEQLLNFHIITPEISTCKAPNRFQARNQDFFRAGEFSLNQGTSIIISSTTHEKKDPRRENIWGFFLLETLRTTFKMRNLTQDGHNQVIFFSNWDTFFQFLKKGRGDSPPPPPPSPPSSYAPGFQES